MNGAHSLRLAYDSFGRLVLTLPSGESFAGVVPVRGFPFSAPSEWISFCDERGRELYCLADMAELPADARTLLERDLSRREFMPVIERIVEISRGAEPTEWHVMTDRGAATFKLTSEDHIRRLGAGAVVVDSRGIRFRLPDLGILDARSRRLLRRYL
jgi:Domain of unknown function (DUF1854)